MSRASVRGLVAVLVLLAPALCSGRESLDGGRRVPAIVPDENVAVVAGYESIAERLGDILRREMELKGLPACSIALVDGDRIVWSEGFGYRDAERQDPATAGTVYRVGSVSKLLTDIGVMQLQGGGELSIRDPIQEILPDFEPVNPFARSQTLLQFMSHRSGLVRESPVGHYFDPTEPTLAETVASLNDTALVYPPGSRTKYSNAGVSVVGYAIEATQGVPFTDWMDDHVLQPLQMNRSTFDRSRVDAESLADAWMWTYDGRRFQAPVFGLGTSPAGNLYSTVNDLAQLLKMVCNEGRVGDRRVLAPETLDAMLTPVLYDGVPQPFGIGFHIQELDGHRQVGHGGAVYGFSTQLEALPDQKLGVAVVSSLDVSNGIMRRVADHALRLMLARRQGEPFPEWETASEVPVERIPQWVGRYRDGDSEIEISEFGNRLYLRRGSYRSELRARGANLVVDDVRGFGPELSRGRDGSIQLLNRTFHREPNELPDRTPARWRGLIGEYGWDHNVLYILEDRGRLYALIEWFYYYPLTEITEDQFAFPDYGLYHGERLVFQRDDEGRATHVVAASVRFDRREVGTRHGQTFRIDPVRPVEELRGEARAASPPPSTIRERPPDLVEVTSLDATIRLDIRYATTNNFMNAVFYRQPRAFMQRPAAQALALVQQDLRDEGLGLLVFDAYRPWFVTKMFWDATPGDMKHFVANPANGSRHNRGCAVDLTLVDLQSGEPIEMVAGYDEFSPRSFPEYPGGTSRQRWYRQRLRRAMEARGFSVYEFEWWHFDYKDWQRYPIMNAEFEELVGEDD